MEGLPTLPDLNRVTLRETTDFNGDGRSDFVLNEVYRTYDVNGEVDYLACRPTALISNGSGYTEMFVGDGDDTNCNEFSKARFLDLNNDGHTDIGFPNLAGNQWYIRFGNGLGIGASIATGISTVAVVTFTGENLLPLGFFFCVFDGGCGAKE